MPLKIDPNLHNMAGTLGLARGSDPNSGSSQFFIKLADNSASLDGKYTVFGRVVSGMDVVTALRSLPVTSSCRSSGGLSCPPVNPSQAMLISVAIINSS